MRAGKLLAMPTAPLVGVGEVFVIAGQSNSANYGEEKLSTKTGLVAAFDGTRWQVANDPQPGTRGSGGSFVPPFGDAMAERFKVPVGIVACGVGGTSVANGFRREPGSPIRRRFLFMSSNSPAASGRARAYLFSMFCAE